MSHTITFKGQKLTQRKCVNAIIRCYQRADMDLRAESKNWYKDAHLFSTNLWLHSELGVGGTQKTAGVIAALSPQTGWEYNKKLAKDVVADWVAGNELKGHTSVMLDKARRILELDGTSETLTEDILDILKGDKISNFFLNIAFPTASAAVTIDRHAQDIALGRVLDSKLRSMTARQYAFFARAYHVAAIKLGVIPNQVQAVTWVQWRLEKNGKL